MDTLAVHQDEGAQPGWPPGCQVLGTGSWGWMDFPAFFFFFFKLPGRSWSECWSVFHFPVTGLPQCYGTHGMPSPSRVP